MNMSREFSRRDVLGGMGVGLAELLFARLSTQRGFLHPHLLLRQAPNGSLTLEAFSNNILRVRVVPLSKLGLPANSYRSERLSEVAGATKNPDGSVP